MPDSAVDMDELLQGDAAASLRAIPIFSGVNILKLEPMEAEAVANSLLRLDNAIKSPKFAKRLISVEAKHNWILTPTLLILANLKTLKSRSEQSGVTRYETEYVLQAWLVDLPGAT